MYACPRAHCLSAFLKSMRLYSPFFFAFPTKLSLSLSLLHIKPRLFFLPRGKKTNATKKKSTHGEQTQKMSQERAPLLLADENATNNRTSTSSSSLNLKTAAKGIVAVVSAVGLTFAIAGDFGASSSSSSLSLSRARLGAYPPETYARDTSKYDLNLQSKKEGEELPIFVHIPKAGGTSVESMVGQAGGKIGSCNSGDTAGKRPFELSEPWVRGGSEDMHTPPATYLENGFTTVRNPYTRMESEFLWGVARYTPDKYDQMAVGYSEETCREFASFIKDVSSFATGHPLLACYLESHYSPDGMQECNAQYFPTASIPLAHSHHVPQYVLARKVKTVFPLETCVQKESGTCTDVNVESSTYGKTMPNLLAYLQHYFSPKITYYEGNGVGLRKDLQKPSVKGCWTDGSIDAETLGKFQLGYSPDFRAYGYDLMPPQMDESSAALGKINYEHPAVKAVSKSLETVENLFASSSSSSSSPSSPEEVAAKETASLASARRRHSKQHRHLNSDEVSANLGGERLMAKDIEFFPTCPI